MARRLGLGEHSFRLAVVYVICVQITVGLLHRDNFIDHFLRCGPKLWKIAGLERESHRLHPFINVRVGINRPTLSSLALADEAPEIVHATVGFEQVVHAGNTLRNIHLTSLSPEAGLNRHCSHRDISELRMRRFAEILDALFFPIGIAGPLGMCLRGRILEFRKPAKKLVRGQS